MQPQRFTITIDTREQQPPSFNWVKGWREEFDTEIDTVPVFDFCIKGDTEFAVERKSLNDFVQSITVTKNYERELRKIAKAREQFYEGAPIIYVVEASYTDLVKTYDYSRRKIHPNFVLSRSRSLVYHHGVHVDYVDGKRQCADRIAGYLRDRFRDMIKGEQE